MIISGIQYMRPDGRPSSFTTEIPDDLRDQWENIQGRGLRLASELLMDGMVSVTLEDDERDHDIEIVDNRPGKPVEAAIAIIARFK
jgi:hypothetical protein